MPSVENKFSVIGFGFLKNGGFFFPNVMQARVIWKERTSNEELPPSDQHADVPVRQFPD